MWGILGINAQGMLEMHVRKKFGMLGSFDGCKYTWMLGMNVRKGTRKFW